MLNKEKIIKNSEIIKNFSDYESHKSLNENAAFVCFVGETPSFTTDVLAIDSHLRNRAAYNRLNRLPKLMSIDDVSFYEEKYNEWLRSFKKKAVTKVTCKNEQLAETLSAALCEILLLFQKARKKQNESIEKNFAVKVLYWYDSVTADLVNDRSAVNGMKIIGVNATKLQEVLFYYLLSLTGADVLLLLHKSDMDIDVKNLGLCARVILGHFGNSDIPEFVRIPVSSPRIGIHGTVYEPPAVSEEKSGNVKVVIPPHPNRQNVRVNQNQSRNSSFVSSNRRVTAPTRTNTSRQAVRQPQTGNIRMTVPPHPNRRPTVVRQTSPTDSGQYYRASIYQEKDSFSVKTQRCEKSYEELARLAASVVQILSIRRYSSREDFDVIGGGSGIMIAGNGYILTNFHVAKQSRDYAVRIENDNKIYFTDRLIKYHSDLDLAIIKIDKKLSPLPIYKDSKPLERGQKVVAIGSPIGLFNTVSDGIISGFRTIRGVDMIQFTAPISSGSSGGALINMYGELIGISTSGVDEGQNINFAVGYDAINNFCMGVCREF